MSNDDVRGYLYYLAEKKNCSASTLNIAINALKFYYGEILKQRFAYNIRRPKKDKKLPVVLSQEEVSKILFSVKNIKHRLILMLMYSAGLRVGEVVKLRVEDVDVKRKLIRIRVERAGRIATQSFLKWHWKRLKNTYRNISQKSGCFRDRKRTDI